jgi:hypothetical protein
MCQCPPRPGAQVCVVTTHGADGMDQISLAVQPRCLVTRLAARRISKATRQDRKCPLSWSRDMAQPVFELALVMR